MVYIGQAGFTATESVQAIQAVANLATGTLSSLTDAANLLTTTLRVFHLEASESARVSDVFANAVNKSKTTVDRLNVTMNYLGPIAHSAGLSLEESASAIMLLSNAGIRASTVGTGFRQVLSRLLAPTAALRHLIRRAGLTLDDFNIKIQNAATNGKGFQTVVKNLGSVIGQMLIVHFKDLDFVGQMLQLFLLHLEKI
jgi:TP901 family phage tail tape measure protein